VISRVRYWAVIHRVVSLILSQVCVCVCVCVCRVFAHATFTSVYVKNDRAPFYSGSEPTLNSGSAMVNIILLISVTLKAGVDKSQAPGCYGNKICLQCCLMFVDPQYGACPIPPFLHLEL
jgi:hypothetical protein